jgi:hypothetical protein
VRAAARSNGNGAAPTGATAVGGVGAGSAAAGAAAAAVSAATVDVPSTAAAPATVPTRRSPQEFDASRPTPFDDDAT